MKYAHFALIILLGLFGLWFVRHKSSLISCRNPGTVIVVTGVSSSGKTSVSRAIQEFYAQKNIPFFLIASDTFLEHFPRQWVDFNQKDPSSMNPDGLVYETVITSEGPKKIQHAGPLIDKMRTATAQVIKALACNGINVIYEGVIEAASLKRGIEDLKPIKPKVILATAPIEVIEQRERDREGQIGLARGQMNEPGFFDYDLYTLDIDTSKLTPQEAAREIYEKLAGMVKTLRNVL